MIRVRLEKHLEHSLCMYPELIDDSLWGIRQAMEFLGPGYPTLKRQDHMPNGTVADMVFVESSCITVVEIKNAALRVRVKSDSKKDVVDQIVGYIKQCRLKYPNRLRYRGIIIGPRILESRKLFNKVAGQSESLNVLVFGKDIPSVIKFCRCGRALSYYAVSCRCGASCPTVPP